MTTFTTAFNRLSQRISFFLFLLAVPVTAIAVPATASAATPDTAVFAQSSNQSSNQSEQYNYPQSNFPQGTAAQGTMSQNWAGYVSTGQTYDGVHGTWTVSDATATTSTAADATWVGVGGYESDDLIQAGTIASIRNGQTTYSAWYELLPSGMVSTPLTVSAGDSITASITSTDATHWTIAITDTTTHQASVTNVTYASSRSSAEWIEERPSLSSGAFIPLGSFGSVMMTNAGAVIGSNDESIASLDPAMLTMDNSSHAVVVQASPIANSSFTLERTSADGSTSNSAPTQSRRGLPQRGSRVSLQIGNGSADSGWHVAVLQVTNHNGRVTRTVTAR